MECTGTVSGLLSAPAYIAAELHKTPTLAEFTAIFRIPKLR